MILLVSESHLGRKAEQKVINSFMGELGRRGDATVKLIGGWEVEAGDAG